MTENTNKDIYVLRTCKEDLTSYNGFQWPESGYVEAPDWDPSPKCGSGLHGLLWGEGNGGLLDWSTQAKWLVVRVDGEVVDLGDKVKFKSGWVEFCGTQKDATDFLISKGAKGPVVGSTVVKGHNQTAIAGYKGVAIAGDGGSAQAGFKGSAQAGDEGTAQVGEGGTIQIQYWDKAAHRYRIKTGYIGENGLKPDTLYRLNSSKDFEEVK